MPGRWRWPPGRREHLGRHRPSEPEALREAHGADRHAEALVDARALAERELRAAAAGVEHDQRAVDQAEPRLHRDVGEPALLLARDHLDGDAGAGADRVDDLVAVLGDPQARRPDRGDRERAVPSRLVDHPRDRGHRPLQRLARDPPVLLEALAEAGQLGAVDDRPPRPVGVALAEVELDRVGPDVDDRVARGLVVEERREPARIAGVDVAAEPVARTVATTAAASSDSIAIVRVDVPSATTSASSAMQPSIV